MIRSFRNDDLRKLWELGKPWPHKTPTANALLRILDLLEAAIEPDSISGFGDRFDEWQEQGTQRYGLMVTEHWLLTYSWEGEDAVAVDFEWIN